MVRQPRVRDEVIWRVSPQHIHKDRVPARGTPPALCAGVVLSTATCVSPPASSFTSLLSRTRRSQIAFRPTNQGLAVIVVVVQKFKTVNPHILHIDSVIFKTALGLFVAFTFSPFIGLLLTLLVPGRKSEAEVRALQQRLGTGRTAKKVGVIAVATSLLLWELVSPCHAGN